MAKQRRANMSRKLIINMYLSKVEFKATWKLQSEDYKPTDVETHPLSHTAAGA